MAASDNPEVGTAMCRGFIQQIMEGADRVQMFVNNTQDVPADPFAFNAIIICANCLFWRP